MKVVTNEALAARRRRQAGLATLAGLAVLVLGFVVDLRAMSAGAAARQQIWVAYGALAVGSLLSWAGVVLTDRWASRPRPDEALEAGLKGAGPAFCLYNWCLPADHVLLTPWGVTVFSVFNQEGSVAIRGKRWRDTRPLARRLTSLGRRAVRDPSRFLALQSSALARELMARDPQIGDVSVECVAVFSSPRVALSIDGPSVPVLRAADLRDWLRAGGRRPAMAVGDRRRLGVALQGMADDRLAASAGGRSAASRR